MKTRPQLRLATALFSLAFGFGWGRMLAAPLGAPVPYASGNQATTRLEVHLAEKEPAVGLSEATMSGSGQRIYLHREVVVTNADVIRARVVPGNGGSGFNVAIVFSSDGAAKMAKATQAHVDRPLAILINGQVVAAPILRSQISDNAVITGDFTSNEAAAIASGLNSR